jgi:hypothetical protein
MDWDLERRLPAGVASHMGYHVYMYTDPRTSKPFYIGKGVGSRVLAHLSDEHDSKKTHLIADLRAAGSATRLEILAHGLKDEETAFRVEAAVIDALGLGSSIARTNGRAVPARGCDPVGSVSRDTSLEELTSARTLTGTSAG